MFKPVQCRYRKQTKAKWETESLCLFSVPTQMRIRTIFWRCSAWSRRWHTRPVGLWFSLLTAWATCTPCTSSTSSLKPGRTVTSKHSSPSERRGVAWPRPSVCSPPVRDGKPDCQKTRRFLWVQLFVQNDGKLKTKKEPVCTQINNAKLDVWEWLQSHLGFFEVISLIWSAHPTQLSYLLVHVESSAKLKAKIKVQL